MKTSLFFLLVFTVMFDGFSQEVSLYVAKNGNNAWPGNLHKPLASLEGARDLIRKLDPKQGGVTVYLREGTYSRSQPFVLEKQDSGSSRCPIKYCAYPGEKVRLIGGVLKTGFQPVPGTRMYKAKLDIQDLGEVGGRGNRLEFFYDHKPMTLARWPNEGFVRIPKLANKEDHTVHGIKGSKKGDFHFQEDRPLGWMDEKEIWLHGYWFWDWSDAFQQVKSLDPVKKIFHLKPPHHRYGYRKGQRYYALNLLSELDAPGEWHLDRETRILHFQPPGKTLDKECLITISPSLVLLKNCSHITLEGLVLEGVRDMAVQIWEGDNICIRECVIHNTGGYGVSIRGGRENGLNGCEIHQTGEGGVVLAGGDRTSLAPAGNYVKNSRIHHFGRIHRTYRPAVMISGVGNVIGHNLIHNGPHNAIQLSGNDHLVEYNEIHHVCYETGDVGAFYMGRDWTMQGNVIQYNYFHHIQGPGLHGAMAVYLDDAASGVTIFGNIFYKAGRAAFIGGGRHNRVQNNVFVDCAASVHVDARGLGWMKYHITGVMKERLLSSPFQTKIWRKRYPLLIPLLEDDPGAPKGNRIENNISYLGKWLDVEKAAEKLLLMKNNLVDQDPLFVDLKNLNFELKPESPALKLGFKPIPIHKIGPK